ncbi:MAG: C10 family peptidase, partial [Muribaculaceae bacterium]|nr:C10 family peptidase [Muribaculaceae bacterium]
MKKVLFLVVAVLAAFQLSAADVSSSQAQAVANTFLKKQVNAGRLKASAASNLRLVKAEASVAKPTAVDYYIFNAEKSYVVVAGDDQAPQILMYGEEGVLDMDNIPPAMQWLLNKYKYQIDGLKAGTMVPVKMPKFATTPVAPLVNANWDQSAPYNNQCPTSGSRRTLTGCPATSLSMCYYKWKWPETFPAVAAINGSSSGGVSAAALSERAADWDNILDEYTGPTNTSYNTTQANAVAWLMRYTGQAIPDYMYGTSASGANDPEIYQGVLNMGYTDAQYLMLTELVQSGWSYGNSQQYYTDAQWNEWMLNELHNGRPIEYLAYDITSGSVSGHAFNVFGVNANGQYYVNWGWSGDSNGYCTLHNFTTNTGATGQSGSYVFKYGEAMIIGIEPPAGALTNPRITVNPATLTMNTTVGTPATATFTVTGANLTSNVRLSISGDNAFSLSTTSISATQAANGVNVTVTYNPSTVGTNEATVTLTSTDAETVTVKLNGTA